jgi:hypothetical protein
LFIDFYSLCSSIKKLFKVEVVEKLFEV